jgi:catechol 2,3-dioxygenase-like lactoylglutathione lyase family enzyme
MTQARTQIRAALDATVLHVADVERSLSFYEQAFGLQRRFVDDRGLYAELETGATTLALTQRDFAAEESCATAPGGLDAPAPACELAFSIADVAAGVASAVAAGATLVRAPTTKYWGQVVAYVRDPDGHLVQIATPLDA